MLTKEIDTFMDWKATHTRTVGNRYPLHLKRFDDHCQKSIEDITLSDIVSFYNALEHKKYSGANISYSVTIIKSFIGFYYSQGICKVSPKLIKIQKPIPKSHYSIEKDEYERMLEVLRDDELWNVQKKIIIRLLWETGVRVSELCALNISDMSSTETRARILTKKNNKQRWIFWSQETHDLIISFLGVRLCTNQRAHLFMTERGHNRPTTRTIERWIIDTVKKAGIEKKITPHSFRHARAHRILDQGGNVVDIQKILGHSDNDPRAAFAYLRLNNTEIEKIARKYP
jgi:site-specific recombinase XerD